MCVCVYICFVCVCVRSTVILTILRVNRNGLADACLEMTNLFFSCLSGSSSMGNTKGTTMEQVWTLFAQSCPEIKFAWWMSCLRWVTQSQSHPTDFWWRSQEQVLLYSWDHRLLLGAITDNFLYSYIQQILYVMFTFCFFFFTVTVDVQLGAERLLNLHLNNAFMLSGITFSLCDESLTCLFLFLGSDDQTPADGRIQAICRVCEAPCDWAVEGDQAERQVHVRQRGESICEAIQGKRTYI